MNNLGLSAILWETLGGMCMCVELIGLSAASQGMLPNK